MTPPNKQNADAWIKKAKDDELSIKAILEHEEGAPSTVCFLSQQMAEKYLKAFLVFHHQEFPKVHQLDKLLELCLAIDPKLETIKLVCIFLNDYYVDARYPDECPNLTFKEAREAYRQAKIVKEKTQI